MPKLPKQFGPEDIAEFEVDEVMGNLVSNLEYDNVPFEVNEDESNEGDSSVLVYCNDGTIKITISRDA